MSTRRAHSGFTVIEVMLFLAVTGALAIGILVGSGVAIGQQRYRDSVTGLKSYIQQQYNEVANVVNNRSKNYTCNTNAAVGQVSGNGQPRGTSDCVIVGRFITSNANGRSLSASNVIAYRTPGAPVAASDIEEIARNYRLGVSPIEAETKEIAWGSQIVQPKKTTPLEFSLLVVRSPLSGSLFTFSTQQQERDLNTMVTAANNAQIRNLCVNADAGTFVGKRLEVRIEAFAANQGAVFVPPESESVCD